jgi:hypothetical protein
VESSKACDASTTNDSTGCAGKAEAGLDAAVSDDASRPRDDAGSIGKDPVATTAQRPADSSTPSDTSPVPDASRTPDASLGSDASQAAPPATDAGSAPAVVDAGVSPPSCSPPLARCADACVDTRSDALHCGGCTLACPARSVCKASRCESTVGCSDGTREAFADRDRYPTIAGCAAQWPSSSLRAAAVGPACGNSLNRPSCSAPADACAQGWHVCGNAVSGPQDLLSRVSEGECLTQPGRWAVALGDYTCASCGDGFGAGAVCCGTGCLVQGGDCLWPGRTPWFGLKKDNYVNACGSIEQPEMSTEVGVLCCHD